MPSFLSLGENWEEGHCCLLLGGIMWLGCVQCFWHKMPTSPQPPPPREHPCLRSSCQLATAL